MNVNDGEDKVRSVNAVISGREVESSDVRRNRGPWDSGIFNSPKDGQKQPLALLMGSCRPGASARHFQENTYENTQVQTFHENQNPPRDRPSRRSIPCQ